jgi:hypothetical protein
MKKINGARSPAAIFVLYILASGLAIMLFRLIFPGEAPPLPCFSRSWRLLRGLLDFCALFPALALSALVLPFGIIPESGEFYGNYSPKLFLKLNGPAAIAICAAVMYGLLLFFAQPAARNYEETLRFKGDLYRMAKEKARAHRVKGEYIEEYLFVSLCESVWPNSPEMEKIKIEAAIHREERRYAIEGERAAARQNLSGERRAMADAELSPVPADATGELNTAGAIALGEAAFAVENFYDAHWYATLAARLAPIGSIEVANANRLAARAWDRIGSLEPNAREKEMQALFRQKQSGYQAMVSGDWVQAYYIFLDLIEKTPDDPDTKRFLAESEKGVKASSFFIDEINLFLGENLTHAVFSLPVKIRGAEPGRAVFRFASLSTASDCAYGADLEMLSFDSQSRPYAQLNAPFVKVLPFAADNQPKSLMLMRALDRQDQSRRFESEWSIEGAARRGDAQIILDISFDDFLVLSRVRRGLPNMPMAELFSASKKFGATGYMAETFQAEILSRLGNVLFFMPVAIIALIIGWRCRTKNRARYMFVPMLAVLPLVFNWVTRLYQGIFSNVGIWLILGIGFTWALTVFIVAQAAIFAISLVILAAQKS